MKKVSKSSKKGFTLVELIVVLVILAILAAMLVPALTGYIRRAREEKEYQTASTVYSAAQAVITDKYGRDLLGSKTAIAMNDFTIGSGSTAVDEVFELAGVDSNAVTDYSFSFNSSNYVITGGSVTINDSVYELTIEDGIPSWSASASST